MQTGAFTRDDVEIVASDTGYQGFYRLDRVQLRHRQFAGGMGPVIKREVLIKPSAAGVLIYDPHRDEVLLVEQFRIGALQEASPWQLEIVAGLIDAGETPETVVRREALEESGVTLGRVEKVMDFLTSPGGTNEKFTLYVAEADLTLAGGVHGLPEEGEDIRVQVLTANLAFQAMANGRINNAPAILALQWLMLNKPRLQARWRI